MKVKSKSKVAKKILKRIKKHGFCVWLVADFAEDSREILHQVYEKTIEVPSFFMARAAGSGVLEIVFSEKIDQLEGAQKIYFIDVSKPVEGV